MVVNVNEGDNVDSKKDNTKEDYYRFKNNTI